MLLDISLELVENSAGDPIAGTRSIGILEGICSSSSAR
jgi:hypothetical protein